MTDSRTVQIAQATMFGMLFFKSGGKRLPFMRSDLMNVIGKRKVGETPKGEAKSTSLMKAFMNGWDDANLAQRFSSKSELSANVNIAVSDFINYVSLGWDVELACEVSYCRVSDEMTMNDFIEQCKLKTKEMQLSVFN